MGYGYSAEGVVLSTRNYGEADRILSVYTKERGKITVIAKGVRKTTSRKRGSLEIFSLVRFGAVGGKGMDIVTEAQILNRFEAARGNLKSASVAYFFVEVIAKTTREAQVNENVFEILTSYLGRIPKTNNMLKLRYKFVEDVLRELGFWPHTQTMENPDVVLDGVVERRINSSRVGRRLLRSV